MSAARVRDLPESFGSTFVTSWVWASASRLPLLNGDVSDPDTLR